MFAEHAHASGSGPPLEPGPSHLRGQARLHDGAASRGNFSPASSANLDVALSCERTLKRCTDAQHQVHAAETLVLKQSVELAGLESKIKSAEDLERALWQARRKVAEFERLLVEKEEEGRKRESALEEKVRKSEQAVQQKEEAAARMTKDFQDFIRDHLASVESVRVETLREDLMNAQAELDDARAMLAESDMQMETFRQEHVKEVTGFQEAAQLQEAKSERDMAEAHKKVKTLEAKTEELLQANKDLKTQHAEVKQALTQELKTAKEDSDSYKNKVAELELQVESNRRVMEETRGMFERENRRIADENQAKLRALESLARELKEENERIQEDFQQRLDLEGDRYDSLEDELEEFKKIKDQAEKDLITAKETSVSLRGQLTRAEMELGKIVTTVSSLQNTHRNKICRMETSHKSSMKKLETRVEKLESEKGQAEADLQDLKRLLETRNQPPAQPQPQFHFNQDGRSSQPGTILPQPTQEFISALQTQLARIQTTNGPNNQAAEDVKTKLRHYIATVTQMAVESCEEDASTSARVEKKKSRSKKERGRHAKEEPKKKQRAQLPQTHQSPEVPTRDIRKELNELRDKHDALWRKYWRQSLRQRALQQVILEQREAQSQAMVGNNNVQGTEQTSENQPQQRAQGANEVGSHPNGEQAESSNFPEASEAADFWNRPLVQVSDLVEDLDDITQESEFSEGEGARVPDSVAEIASRYWGRPGQLEIPASREACERAAQFEGLEGQARPCSAPSSNVPRSRPVNADDLMSNFVDAASDTSFLTSRQSGDEDDISQC